jgi:hypothetical protein
MTHIYYIHFLHGNLWLEAFGDRSNPIALLIAWDKKKSIYWNDTFCQALVEENDVVVRSYHRDTGLSKYINVHLTLCGLLNLANDALCILHFYEKLKMHFIGSSRVGCLAQIRALSTLENVFTLVLFITTDVVRSIEQTRFDVTGKEITSLWFIHNQFYRVVRAALSNPLWVPNTIQKLKLANEAAPFDQTEGLCHDLTHSQKQMVTVLLAVIKVHMLRLLFTSYAAPIIPVQHACSMKHHSPHEKRSAIKGMWHL